MKKANTLRGATTHPAYESIGLRRRGATFTMQRYNCFRVTMQPVYLRHVFLTIRLSLSQHLRAIRANRFAFQKGRSVNEKMRSRVIGEGNPSDLKCQPPRKLLRAAETLGPKIDLLDFWVSQCKPMLQDAWGRVGCGEGCTNLRECNRTLRNNPEDSRPLRDYSLPT
jgi:hypothetical protein